MITKVKLKNWRSHEDTEINFSDGTNCFVGPMGSGKTSIMDAICFGLFGTFLQLQQKKIKLEDVIMKKPAKKDKSQVEVFFDINGTEWSVKRSIEKGRSTAELRKNEELVEGPQTTKVTNEIESALKMDYDLFTRAVYSEQNQLDMFLTIPKGQRMRKIDELLSIDKFEKARSSVKSLINRSLTVANEKEKIVQNLSMDESLNKIDFLKKEIFDLREKEEKMRKQLEDVIKRKNNAERDVSNLKEQQKRLQTIEEDTKKFNALLEVVEADIEKLKEDLVEFAEKTIEELENENEKIDEEINILDSNLEQEKINLDNLKESFAEENAKINLIETERVPNLQKYAEELEDITNKLKNRPLKKLERELNSNNKDLEKNQIKIQKSLAKISEIEESIHNLSLAGSTCPICGAKLTEKKKKSLVSKRKEQIEKLKKEANTIKPMIKKVQASIARLQEEIKDSEIIQKRFEEIKDSEKELKILSDDLKKLKSKTKVFDNQKKMFEKNINLIEEKLKSLKENQEKIKQALSKGKEVDEKLEKSKYYKRNLAELSMEKEKFSSFSPSVLERVEQEYQSLLGLESEVKANFNNLAVIKEDKQKLLDEIENKRKILENYKNDIRKIEAISEQLKFLENGLLATQEQLRKDFVLAVNQAMQSIWIELYPYRDIYSIRLGIEEGDYVLQLQDSTGWVPADGVASGGERSMACLTLRIAFSLVLAPQLKWLVLDEPTHNLDNKAVEELANILRDKISNFVEQVFLITHDPSLENAVSGYLYRFEREKEKDGYTKVSLVSSPED